MITCIQSLRRKYEEKEEKKKETPEEEEKEEAKVEIEEVKFDVVIEKMIEELTRKRTEATITMEAELEFMSYSQQLGIHLVDDKLLCCKDDRLVSVDAKTLRGKTDILGVKSGNMVATEVNGKVIVGGVYDY